MKIFSASFGKWAANSGLLMPQSKRNRVLKSGLSGLLALAFVVTPIGPQSVNQVDASNSGDRTLWVHYTHTGERERVTFRKNGKYVKKGLERLAWLTRDWRRNLPKKDMDPRLFDLVWSVYQEVGATQPIRIVSGFRSKKTNDALRRRSRGVARFSQHTLGKAMDFYIPGVPIKKLREVGMKMGIGGVGYYPGSKSPFVHMDTGRVRHWPRMTPKQLARLFPDGKTLHTPTTRKKLPRYAQALAEYKAKQNKLIQPLSRSKRTVVAKAGQRDKESRSLLGLFRSDNKKKSKPTTPKVIKNQQPTVIASRVGREETASTNASSIVTAAIPRVRPTLKSDAVTQPVVVANRLDENDTTPIPSRIGRPNQAPKTIVASITPPAPRPVPRNIRDGLVNNNALVVAGATNGRKTPSANGPLVISASLDAKPESKPEIDQTVTAALTAEPEVSQPPVVIRSSIKEWDSNEDPTQFVIKGGNKKSKPDQETAPLDIQLAYAPAKNPVAELPKIDRATFDERFSHIKVASEAIRKAAKAVRNKPLPPLERGQAFDFNERFANIQPVNQSQYRLASIASSTPKPAKGNLAKALASLVKKTNAPQEETLPRTASAPKRKNPDITFKTKILQNLHSAGLLTASISTYQKLDLPKPQKMPELFSKPNNVYAGSFSHKGDVALAISFEGNAIKPTPMKAFSELRFSQLNGSQTQ